MIYKIIINPRTCYIVQRAVLFLSTKGDCERLQKLNKFTKIAKKPCKCKPTDNFQILHYLCDLQVI